MNIIQIGANKGNTDNDMVWAMCEQAKPQSYKWNLILVEPNPYAMSILKKSYDKFENVRFVEAAVSNRRGSSYLYIDNVDKAGHEGSQHASLNKSHLLKMGHQKTDITSIQVSTILFEDLVNYNQPVDLLQIDTEGHDFEILMSIDFNRHVVNRICYEYIHMTKKQHDAIINELRTFGYERKSVSQEDEVWSKI